MLVTCTQCHKEFDKYPSQIKKSKNHFCSSSCSATYNNCLRKSKKQFRSCLNCEKDTTNSKYCCIKCQKDYELNSRIESGNFSAKTGKKHLLRKDNRCSICGLGSLWNNKDIVMILDHVDGNSENNNLSNLRLVCPNCDSQLSTFKGRNKGNGRHSRRKRYKNRQSY